MMKVHDVLKNYDFLSEVKIIEMDYAGNECNLFFGKAYDCPWSLADMIIDTNSDGEGMFVDIDEESGKVYLGIYAKEAE